MRFTPAEMGIIKVICHKDYERELIRCLHEIGEVELIDVMEQGGTVAAAETSEVERTVFSLLNEIQRHVDYLGLEKYVPYLANKIPKKKRWMVDDRKIEKVLELAQKTLAKVDPKIQSLSQELLQVQQELDKQKTVQKIAETLEPLDISLDQLGAGKYVYAVAGTVLTIKSGTLRWRIKEVTEGNYIFRSTSIGEGRDVVFISFLNQYRGVVERVLTAFGFEQFKLPPDVKGTTKEIIHKTASNIKKLEESLNKLEEQRMDIIKNWGYQLLVCKELLTIEKNRIDAKKYFRITKSTVEVWGWFPLNKSKILSAAIDSATDRTAIIEITKSIPPEEERPTKMENPRIIGAYQKLVKAFGIPNYHEIDPTKFFILTFPVFFGLMFPDIAHGAILAFIALMILVWKSRKPVVTGIVGYIVEGAGLLFICGIFAVIFGFIFGSFFGSHAVYDPLWYNPFTQSGNFRFLRLSVIIGVAEITFGFSLRFNNLWRNGKRKMAVFQPLCLIWFYLGAFLIIYSDEYSVNFMNWFSPYGAISDNLTTLITKYYTVGLTASDLPAVWQIMTPFWYTTLRPLKALEPLGLGNYIMDTQLWHILEAVAEIQYFFGEKLLLETLHTVEEVVIINTTAWGPVIHLPPVQILTIFGVLLPVFLTLFGTIAVSHDRTEAFSEQLDYLISCLSHTVSFSRIFALAAVHVILSVIFLELPGPPALANVVKVSTLTGLLTTLNPALSGFPVPSVVTESLLWAAVGTIVILGLEGLIAFMNTLRLHWVEFFSKFYHGDGREFTPFTSARQLTQLEKPYDEKTLEKEIAIKTSSSKGRFRHKDSIR
ncbi:MAG: hypothetical protein KIH08_00650 [Candidatus Freyarchaeota archaeon]|nr:hypothetical protein [Candidatus Jordarchaeia archaeon]MBS7267830.1 hypothetical protein [Candidatus Jordarchaeia archaeon]